MLMTELLEARNEASAAHAYIENQVEALRQRLLAIERRLPPEPVSCPSCWTEPLSPCEGVVTTNVPEGEMAVLMPGGELRWRTQNQDGTWRDCID